MTDLGDVTRGLRATSHIGTRKDLERWRARSISSRRFLMTAYFSGMSFAVLMGAVACVIHLRSGKPFESDTVWPTLLSVVLGGICCSGPLTLVACWLVLWSGLNNYRKLLNELINQNRVCYQCSQIALFDDQYVNPVKKYGHTRADLIPAMHMIEQDGETLVLCGTCLAQREDLGSGHA